MKSMRLFALGVLLTSQVFMIATMHTYHTHSGRSLFEHHPAQKHFTQEVHQHDDYTVIDNDEDFIPEGDGFMYCGHIYQERWFPKLYAYRETYTAFLRDGADQTNSREFNTLAEAEQYLFSHDCPSNKWGRIQK